MSMPLSYQIRARRIDVDETLRRYEMEEYAKGRGGYNIQVVDTFPSLYDIHDFTFIGSFAWTCQAKKWKILHARNAVLTKVGFQTPAELARDYIAIKYDKPGRVFTSQYLEFMRHRQPPLYAQPGVYENASYIDLKSAYWSILQVIGWDVDYMPGRWLSTKSDVRDFPYWKNKLARNCLVSVGLVGMAKAWTGEKLVTHRKRNPYTNMMLWACVQDVLMGIAHDMVRAGAVYVHTDGYIVKEENLDTAFEVFQSWGLTATIRSEGRHEVIGAGTYSSPKKPNNRLQNMRPRAHNGLAEVKLDWLRDRFSRFAHKIELKLG